MVYYYRILDQETVQYSTLEKSCFQLCIKLPNQYFPPFRDEETRLQTQQQKALTDTQFPNSVFEISKTHLKKERRISACGGSGDEA